MSLDTIVKSIEYLGSLLSIPCCLFVIYFSIKARDRVLLSKFTINQGISELIYSIANLSTFYLTYASDLPLACTLEVLRRVARNASIIWAANIPIFSYWNLTNQVVTSNTKFTIVSYAIAIIFALVSHVFSTYTDGYGSCENAPERYPWRLLPSFILYYLPVLLGVVIGFIYYVKVAKIMKNIHHKVRTYWVYPFVLAMIWLFASLDDFIRGFIDPEFVHFKGLHLWLTRSIGVINALLYGLRLKKVTSQEKRKVERKGCELNLSAADSTRDNTTLRIPLNK